MKCERCGTEKRRIINSTKYNAALCKSCYNKADKISINPIPPYGDVKYDEKGRPICHICGEGHKKLMSHVHQKHNISARDYKKNLALKLDLG